MAWVREKSSVPIATGEMFYIKWERRDLLVEPCEIRDGYLQLPDRPGYGIELNEDYLRAHP